jgi:hypothetical protein
LLGRGHACWSFATRFSVGGEGRSQKLGVPKLMGRLAAAGALAPPASPIGLRTSDIPVFVSNVKAWANLPSKPQIDGEGRQKTDINGRAVLELRSCELSDRFSEATVALVRAAHSADLELGGTV